MPTNDELVQTLNNLPVIQLCELTRALEETWGVKASAPVVQQAPPTVEPEKKVEEQTEFSVILNATGDKKIEVIKVVRAATGLGLAEAKALVESSAAGPKPIKESISKAEAETLKSQLEAAGAKVALQ